MAVPGNNSALSEAHLLALTGEDTLEEIRELTLRNNKLVSFDQGDTHRLINLQVMSLSHNMLSSLAGFQHLKQLVSLNINFNVLANLEGISHCTALQHLFVANNRVRDISPLAPCTSLQTLHLFRNNISNLDQTMAVLEQFPELRELELAGNPCSLVPDYKHRVVLQLELASLDGDPVTQLDYDLANEFFAANGGMPPGLGPQVDILKLEEVDANGGSVSTTEAASASDSAADVSNGDATTAPSCTIAADTATAAVASVRSGAESASADANGRTAVPAWIPPTLPPRSGSAAARSSSPAGPGPSATQAQHPPPLLPRPGTAARRPGSAAAATCRPGSASGFTSSVQLLSNEILNDHPLILEYLAKHVLQEGLALTEGRRPSSGGGTGNGDSGVGGSGRGPSFAQRLRDTAAAMSMCEGVDAKTLAEQQQELIATSQTVRRGLAEEMVAAATPNELCRQLVRLCEVLIKEVEACRSGRPSSSGNRPGTAAGRPGTAMGLRPTTPGVHSVATTSSALTPTEVGELMQLRVDVERLCRENKTLRYENENMYWLMEEVKRLKTELAKVQEK